jgi:hypothetical protein
VQSVVVSLDRGVTCAIVFVLGSVGGAVGMCWAARTLAPRLGGRFRVSDALLFGTAGGGLGALAASAYCLFEVGFGPPQGTAAFLVEELGAGVSLGAPVGLAAAALFWFARVWREASAERRARARDESDPAL